MDFFICCNKFAFFVMILCFELQNYIVYDLSLSTSIKVSDDDYDRYLNTFYKNIEQLYE